MRTVDVLQWALDVWTTWAQHSLTLTVDQHPMVGHPLPAIGMIVPLPSVFHLISLQRPAPVPPLYIAPDFSPVPVIRPYSPESFRTAWNQCVQQIIQETRKIQGTSAALLEQLMAISDQWAYGFGIPVSPAGPIVPVPVFLRMQVAWRLAAEGHRAQLVYGDLSGIQSYVFAAHRVGVHGLAKTLRARSARIGWIALGLPWAASEEYTHTGLLVLSAVGGGFSLLLPPSQSFQPWREEVNTWLQEHTHARVQLITAERAVSADEFFTQYAQASESLHRDVAVLKRQPFAEIFGAAVKTNSDPWIWRNLLGLPRCVVCEEQPAQEPEGLCTECALDRRIGAKVWRMHWMTLRHDAHGLVPIGDQYSVDLSEKRPRTGTVRAINVSPQEAATPTTWMNLSLPVASEECPHCLASQVRDPVRAGQLYTFECLAALDAPEGAASPRLGYLKADVDNLGLVFALGLRDGPPAGGDVYRVMMLSEALDRFFTEGLRTLMETRSQFLYAVFSGGDDVYLIGGARHIAQFALTLHKAFQEYTGYHEEMSLSAGLIFVPPHLSLALATSRVETALQHAKNIPAQERQQQGQTAGRNQVAIGETSLSWARYQALWEEATQLSDWKKQGLLGGSALHRLRQYAEYAEHRPAGERGASWFPHVAYEIRRNFMDPAQVCVRDWLMTYTDPDDARLPARIGLFPLLVSLVNLLA